MSVRLGHFELHEKIGEGGMATVFRAYDPTLNRYVAIKVMNQELAREDPQFVENFLREARHAAAINHPNVVHIYFVGEEQGNYYLVMELLEGHTLEDHLESSGTLDEGRVLDIAIQVTEALKAAHAIQLVHGDIKPQNIFIANSGRVKLLDFGLADLARVEVMNFALVKLGKVDVERRRDGLIWGSAYYISPERVGQKAEDLRSDIYSLGATMFHALVGHPPFDAATNAELAEQRLFQAAPHLRQIDPELSERTAEVVAKMLEKTPFVRHVNHDTLLEDLHDAASHVLRKSMRAVPSSEPATPPAGQALRTRSTSPLALVVTLIAATLGIGAVLLAVRKGAPPAPANPTYVDAGLANTTGSTFVITAESFNDNRWSIRVVGSNNSTAAGNTVLEAAPQGGSERVPGIATVITGLKPGATYEIFVYFMTHPTSDRVQNWQIRASLEPNHLTAYDHDSAVTTVLLPGPAPKLVDSAGKPLTIPAKYHYRQFSLGPAVASASGAITVFVNSGMGHHNENNRTWYDGVGYKLLDRDGR